MASEILETEGEIRSKAVQMGPIHRAARSASEMSQNFKKYLRYRPGTELTMRRTQWTSARRPNSLMTASMTKEREETQKE